MPLKKWLDKNEVRVAARSDVGVSRSENEDAFGHFANQADGAASEHLFVVADGMGGHEHGKEASQTAVRVVRDTFFDTASEPVEVRLKRSLQAANLEVFALSDGEADLRRAGTTCTALAFVEGELYLAHVGDSRAYRIGRRRIEQFSTDHTLTAELEREGILTSEEARLHERRHTLTRAIGVEEQVDIDVGHIGSPRSRDVYLLCSDGLDPVPQDEIHRIVRNQEIDAAAATLIRMANERGGRDNVTVLLIRFG